MINESLILETINMIKLYNLDIRTVTLALSLRDCISEDVDVVCEKIYNKIIKYARNLVEYANDLENDYSIPIINKRIAVTPISIIGESCKNPDYVKIAKTLDKAAQDVGVNFIGGFSALVEKGFTKGDELLMNSIPEALAVTERLCSSINLASSKAGINMDAVLKMAEIIKKAAELMSEAGARKVRVLKTSGPFHTTKLIEASKALSKELENTKFNKSNLKVVKNIDGTEYTENDNIKEILAKHIISPVRFSKSINTMLQENVDTFIEVGPGKTLSGFVKKAETTNPINILNINNVDTLENTIKFIKEETTNE